MRSEPTTLIAGTRQPARRLARRPGTVLRLLDQVHRWTGGLLGLLLALMGVTGTILLHEDVLVRATVAHAADQVAPDDARLAAISARYLGGPNGARAIRFAGDGLGVHRLTLRGEAGAYVDQGGAIVARWTSEWQRPEVWLFDLHHHLLLGDTGTTLVGMVGVVGLGFLVTGVLLWWRTRSTFAPRLLPARASRPAIVRHHRDLGILVAPLLLVSFTSGAMMALKPVEALMRPPPGRSTARRTPPSLIPPRASASAAVPYDWQAILGRAHARFPAAEFRWIGLPTAKEPRLQVRMRQAGEWTPNGRTILFFDGDGRLVETRDPRAATFGERVRNIEYPMHLGIPLPAVGKWLLTLSGLALGMLGCFTTITFWFAGGRSAASYRTGDRSRLRRP